MFRSLKVHLMLRRILFCCLAVMAMSGLPSLAAPPTDFTVESPTHDSTFKLSEARGKTVVLHFLLKTECPLCMRHTQTYAAKSMKTPEVMHVFLKPDSAEEIKKWTAHLDSNGLKDTPVIYRDANATLAKSYQIPNGYQFHGETMHFPAMVVLDGTGAELFRYVGKSNRDRMQYEDFEKMLAAKMTGAK
jgi:thioredoxin-dependent peroxiredoxin